MHNIYFVFYTASLVIPANRTVPGFTTAELVCSFFKIHLKTCAPLLGNGERMLGVGVVYDPLGEWEKIR